MICIKHKFSEAQRNVRCTSQQVSLHLTCQSHRAAGAEDLNPDACRMHGSKQVVGRTNEGGGFFWAP